MLSAPQASGLTTTPSDRLSACADALKPCGAKTGTAELSACLVLVAPSGMGQAERNSWLKVARDTLRGIPQDLLEDGCQVARRRADHPSKIIPLIMETVEDEWEERKSRYAASVAADGRPKIEPPPYAPPPPPPEYISPDEAKRILQQFGLRFDPEKAAE